MIRNLTLLTALAAGLVSAPFAVAQAPAAAPAAAPAPAAAAPVAVDAKIALVNFEQVVLASNEGQTVTLATQKKYEPKRADLEKLAAEVDSMKKSLQAAPTTLPDDERATRLRAIDTKEKQLNRDAEDAQTAYNAEWQEALGKVAQKIATTMKNYAQTNGYTILLDVSAQNSNVLWALPSTDISQAVVDAYNKQSGIPAPPPQAPRATTPRPAGASTPRPSGASTAPKK
jgi:outer membrane protein